MQSQSGCALEKRLRIIAARLIGKCPSHPRRIGILRAIPGLILAFSKSPDIAVNTWPIGLAESFESRLAALVPSGHDETPVGSRKDSADAFRCRRVPGGSHRPCWVLIIYLARENSQPIESRRRRRTVKKLRRDRSTPWSGLRRRYWKSRVCRSFPQSQRGKSRLRHRARKKQCVAGRDRSDGRF